MISIGSIYVLLVLVFYFFQDFFFFRPEVLPSWFRYDYPFPFDEVHYQMEDGGEINGVHFRVPNSKGVVFYLKGNSRSVKGWGKFAKDFLGKGYDFFMIDYRGFGKSRGKRSQQTLLNDAQHVYKRLEEEYPESKIILYGRSLGSGIAARLSSWNRPQLLILDSPYFSFQYHIRQYAFYLPLRWLLRYPLRTDQYLTNTACPIYILHGTKDRLIAFRQSEKLKDRFPQIHLFPVEGAGHNNLPDFADYHQKLYEILNEN